MTYSFYPVYCKLFGIAYETIPLDEEMRVRVADYRRPAGAIILANPNAPTGIALGFADIAELVAAHPDIPVVVDEAYVDFGGETAIPLIASHPNLLVVRTMSKSRALAGLRVGYALGDAGLIEALTRVKDSFNSYPLGRPAQAGAIASVEDEAYFQASREAVMRGAGNADRRAGPARLQSPALGRELRVRAPPEPRRRRTRGGLARTRGAGAPFRQAAHFAVSANHGGNAGGNRKAA